MCFSIVLARAAPYRALPLQTDKAHALLVEMRAARGVSTNMSSYRAVIDAYCRAGDWGSAQGLLEDARRDQLKPGAVDLRTLVEVRDR